MNHDEFRDSIKDCSTQFFFYIEYWWDKAPMKSRRLLIEYDTYLQAHDAAETLKRRIKTKLTWVHAGYRFIDQGEYKIQIQ